MNFRPAFFYVALGLLCLVPVVGLAGKPFTALVCVLAAWVASRIAMKISA